MYVSLKGDDKSPGLLYRLAKQLLMLIGDDNKILLKFKFFKMIRFLNVLFSLLSVKFLKI
jgi:hypothetical protein